MGLDQGEVHGEQDSLPIPYFIVGFPVGVLLSILTDFVQIYAISVVVTNLVLSLFFARHFWIEVSFWIAITLLVVIFFHPEVAVVQIFIH